MQFLHSQNIIHCDLKPGNILLDESGHPRIADLGSARPTLDLRTPTPNISTPAYRAPEMLDAAADHTPKVDSYAFGLVLFEVLTGSPAFEFRLRSPQIAYKSFFEERPAVPQWVHPSLKTIIERCWDPLPTPRLTFDDILDELERANYPFYPDVDVRAVRNYIARVRGSEHS
jgi:serine/threonine protein kinase